MGTDSYDEMHHFLPGEDTYDRMLSGRATPLDLPDSLRGVAELFEAAAGPAAPHELARKSQVIAAAAAEVLSSQPSVQGIPSRRNTMLSKIFTAKFAAAATVATFGLGTAAAAVTGSLPGQTSHANSHAATGLSIAAANVGSNDPSSVASGGGSSSGGAAGSTAPMGGGQASTAASSDQGTTGGSSTGIPGTGPANIHAQYGLCTAFLASGPSSTSAGSGSTLATPPQYNSTAFKALIAQNNGIPATISYCQGVVSAKTGSSATSQAAGGQSDAGMRPADPGQSGSAGRPADAGQSGSASSGGNSSHGRAPVSTPNSGGTGTAGTASRGASDGGASSAAAASNGASSAGSGNSAGHH